MTTPQPKLEPKPPIQIRPAIPSDLPSLTTIVPRAFHPRNAYIKKCHPDTPAVRAWWWKIFAEEIAEPDCYVLVAAIGDDDDGNLLEGEGGGGEGGEKGMKGGGEEEENVVGVLCLRLMPPITSSSISSSSSSSSSNNQNENEEKENQTQTQKEPPLLPCGFWSKHPLTPDQNSTLFQPAITAMSQARALAFSPSPSNPTTTTTTTQPPNQEAAPQPQPHFLLELLGISHDYQNLQLARRLLTLAGEISDQAGWETFVEANASAVGLYRKMGFEEVGKMEIPWVEDDDEDEDEEHGRDGDGEGEHGKKKEGKEVKMYVEHMLIRPVGGGTTRGLSE